MRSKVSGAFWKRFEALPSTVQELAEKNYLLWVRDPQHRSLRFKRVREGQWSVRIGDHYRAVGYFQDASTFVWTWIGAHEAYNKF